MDNIIRLFTNEYSYYANIIKIFDYNICKIIKYLKNINKSIISISIPNTIEYCLKYKETYYIRIEIYKENHLNIPLIVGSKYEKKKEIDLKGYFIIDGKFKVIVNQEVRKFYNYCIISKNDKYIYYCSNFKYNLEIEGNYIYIISKDGKNKINLINVFYNEKLIINNKLINIDYLNEENYNLINNKLSLYFKDDTYYDVNFDKNELKKIIISFIDVIRGNIFEPNDDIYFSIINTSGDIVFKIFEESIIKNKRTNFKENIRKLFKLGQLNINDKRYDGICQELSRRNAIDTLSHIRRVGKMSTINKNIPESVRSLNGSNFGYICCNETPESLDVGITKYLALFCIITTIISNKSMNKIYKFVSNYKKFDNKYILFINNNFIDYVDHNFLKKFKEFRISNYDLKYVSIFESNNSYYINTTEGRYIRPLLRKNKVNLIINNYTLKDLYKLNIMEYIDVYEFKNCILNDTHLELNDLSILGISAGITPFLNTNQSTRITFQSGMVKQTISLNNKIMNISDIKVLIYGQIPICKTIINDLLNFKSYGINVLICVLPYKGYNQEDALVFKKSSANKGMFSSYRYDLQEIIFDNTLYKIEELLPKGSIVTSKSKIFIKINIINNMKEYINVKYNTTFHKNVIDDIKIIEINKKTIISVVYRRYDMIQIGDKLSSRYSQKGVIGFIENDLNLPFTKDGIIPDIFINPHSLPSRMTIGHIIETVKTVEGIKKNKYIDSSGFNFEKINGTIFYKKKKLFNNINFCHINTSIGYCYYQLLKHQVIEKIYSMTEGPNNLITNQPINGKNNRGGLRLGELDKDCLVAHGTTNIIYEKFIQDSDKYKMYFCKDCYNICKKSNYCIYCNNNKIDFINTTYSFKLLCDLLTGLNINTLLFKE